MSSETLELDTTSSRKQDARLGSAGHILILFWMMAMVLLVPAGRIWFSAGLCLVLSLLLHPESLRRLLRVHTLTLLIMVLLAGLLFSGNQPDYAVFGIRYSTVGVTSALQMVLRAVVILVAVDVFSVSVEIGEVAGAIERLGMRGLGFSIGVAFNLLPSLRQAATNTWHSMWMRGGLRRHRLHSLRLLFVTILTSALRRGDEIALAAEARGFTPEHSRAIPLRKGKLDAWLVLPLFIIFVLFLLPKGWIP